MLKLIKKLILVSLIAGIVFLALSLWQGGKPFRWFGKKSEHAGEVLKNRSEEIGKEADEINQKAGSIKETTKKVTEGMKKAGEKVKDITGSRDKE